MGYDRTQSPLIKSNEAPGQRGRFSSAVEHEKKSWVRENREPDNELRRGEMCSLRGGKGAKSVQKPSRRLMNRRRYIFPCASARENTGASSLSLFLLSFNHLFAIYSRKEACVLIRFNADRYLTAAKDFCLFPFIFSSFFFFLFLPSFLPLSFLFSLFIRAAYRMMTARMQRFEATSAMFLRWIQKTKETKERWVKYGCGRERWKERGRGRKRAGELKNCRP